MAKSDYIPLPEHEDFDPDLRRSLEFASAAVDPELVDHSKLKIQKDKLKLSGDGTFYTLQGEGPTMGLPCVFCRLHVCNLRCTWCDAWYTWNPHTPEYWTESQDVSFEEAAKRISTTWGCPGENIAKRVIFTGGEPLIQRKQLVEVFYKLEGIWNVEVETNGTLMPTQEMFDEGWQFNCSPKLSNSDNRHHSMVKPKVLEALSQNNTTFKFVCYDEKDIDEIEEKYLPHISKDQVIIMPEGIRSEEVDAHMKDLYEPCMRRGYRLLGRMQSQFADGARRGV